MAIALVLLNWALDISPAVDAIVFVHLKGTNQRTCLATPGVMNTLTLYTAKGPLNGFRTGYDLYEPASDLV